MLFRSPEMHPRDAIIDTMNFAFPTIVTSGSMMVLAGFLIGNMTSDPCISGIGMCLGRGTIISILAILFALPQILLLGDKVIEKTSFERNKTEFIICCGDLTEDDYAPETLRRVNDLAEHSESQIDKRIGSIVRQNLKKGYITADGYEAHGEIGQWYYDMKLAEQMGLVSRVTKDRYAIMRDAQPRLSMLDPVQKMRVRQMYDKFGDETFSLEMVVATLDYSSNKASACLHQFTLLRILDCRKEDQLLYQFIVNPKENPEIFSEAA